MVPLTPNNLSEPFKKDELLLYLLEREFSFAHKTLAIKYKCTCVDVQKLVR